MSEKTSTISPNLNRFLQYIVNKEVTVDIREANIRLKGTVQCYDQYSNILLTNVSEFEKSPEGKYLESTTYSGSVLVRGDSIHNITQ